MRVELLSGQEADAIHRSEIVDLRRRSYGHDDWGDTDDRSRHLLAFHNDEMVGYYRVLFWSSIEDRFELGSVSPVISVFRFNQSEFDNYEVIELGRLCIQSNARGHIIPRVLWRYLFERLAGFNKPVFGLGMTTAPAGHEDRLLHDYEIVRSIAPCRRTGHFSPRVPARFGGTCSAGPVSDNDSHVRLSTVRAYLRVGARFGPLARWPSFGNRVCMLTSIVPDELKL